MPSDTKPQSRNRGTRLPSAPVPSGPVPDAPPTELSPGDRLRAAAEATVKRVKEAAKAAGVTALETIQVVGANEHNLQNVSITLPRDSLTVFTGVSGSGKSSLAFDTLFKEGQRRYMESLSPYARQFLGQMEKPKVEHVEGLSPTVSIDQKT